MRWDPELGAAVGAVLRLWRVQAALSQQGLADRMGSFREVICRLEQGRHHQPSLDTVARYARATGGDMRQVLVLVDLWAGVAEELRSPAVSA